MKLTGAIRAFHNAGNARLSRMVTTLVKRVSIE